MSWTADGIFGPGEDEVWVQRLSSAGAQLGGDRRISTIGAAGDLTVRVNGKLVRTVRGKRITAQVDLRGLPRGRFRVKIEVRTVDGRKVSATRRYRTCAPKRR